MSVTERQLQPGDALVHDSGHAVVIKSIAEGDAICDDSNFRRERRYELERLQNGIDSGSFQLVRDSELTAIKGIGDSTAPKIEATTGCSTPEQLARAYLTEQNSGVRDAVRRVDYLNEWLQDNLAQLEIGVPLAKLRVMLFLIEHGAATGMSSLRNVGEITTTHYNSIKGEKLTTNHLVWEPDSLWVESANVAAVARSVDGLTEVQPAEMWDTLQPCDSYEPDGNHYRFTVNGGETVISGDYLDSLQDILTFELSDVHCHPDGEYPILVYDADTELVATVAPRIQ